MSSIKSIFTDIADAIRNKLGGTMKLKPEQMANAINDIKIGITPTGEKEISIKENGSKTENVFQYAEVKINTNVTPKLESVEVTPSVNKQEIYPSAGYDGISSVFVNKVDSTIDSNILPENIKKDISILGVFGTLTSGGGLPSSIQAIDCGTYKVGADFTTTRQTVTHNLGVVPDFVMFYSTSNVAQTYSMLFAMRGSFLGYRSSAYNLFMCYHGNSTTTTTLTNSNSTTYGVSNMTSTTFQLASSSSSYYWRAGTYNYIAIKFK